MIRGFDFPLKDLFIKIFKDKIYLVGGIVRDYILYKQPGRNQDVDLVVVDHTYREIEKKFRFFEDLFGKFFYSLIV